MERVMLRTVMAVVTLLGAFGIVGVFWFGVSKAHNRKNSYLRERARWPSSRYGGFSEEAAARHTEESARPRRIAIVWVAGALLVGFLAGWAASALGATFGVRLVVQMAVTYSAVWVGLPVASRFMHRG
jgi:hypothetical protein